MVIRAKFTEKINWKRINKYYKSSDINPSPHIPVSEIKINKENVYILNTSGVLYVIDLNTGELKWIHDFNLETEMKSLHSVDLFFNNENFFVLIKNTLYSFDYDGNKKFVIDVSEFFIRAGPTFDDKDNIYIVEINGNLKVIDKQGEIQYKLLLPSGNDVQNVIPIDEYKVLIYYSDESLISINLN